MSAAEASSTQIAAEDFTRTWRYKVGLFLIVVGQLILLAGVRAPFIGAGAGIVNYEDL